MYFPNRVSTSASLGFITRSPMNGTQPMHSQIMQTIIPASYPEKLYSSMFTAQNISKPIAARYRIIVSNSTAQPLGARSSFSS